MIASIAGDVAVRRSGHVVVETAGGVGYRLSVSAETLRQVPAAGGSVSLLTYLSVREDALSLYGFATEEERALFELLVGVQGVGPEGRARRPRRRHAARADRGDRRRRRPPPAEHARHRQADRRADRRRAARRRWASSPPAESPIVVSRSDEPHELARAGLLELGYDPGEADALLRTRRRRDGRGAARQRAARRRAGERANPDPRRARRR